MEKSIQKNVGTKKWLHIIFGIGLLISFFLPWVKWNETLVAGFDMPAGNFFTKSVAEFGPANPFPQLDFTFYIFWLIPVLIIVSLSLCLQIKGTIFHHLLQELYHLPSLLFLPFTKIIISFGIGTDVFQMLQLPSYIAVITAIGFILTASVANQWVKKIAWLFLGPVIAFSAFKFGEKKVMAETYQTTDNVKADYTISAVEMLNEFVKSDSLANVKYREKIVIVNGTASQVEKKNDSTTNIRFDDPEGSYIVFSFEKDQYELVKDINPGDEVSLKGSCSGSIYSEILETIQISFKRSTLNKN
ncbi:MAG: hypothetical protein IPL04_00975 [Chitinophagaceae bacterium]|nr:hypothetical protein [Chitinophagaceae bacterium]